MKNCPEIQLALSAWLDDELSRGEADDVAQHLVDCVECRAFAESLRQLDSELTRSAARDSANAERIARNALARLAVAAAHRDESGERSERFERSESSGRSITPAARSIVLPPWFRYLSAAAAGFLVAWLMFAQSAPSPLARAPVADLVATPDENRERPVHAPPTSPPTNIAFAQLTVATDAIELRRPGESNWSLTLPASPIACPPGTSVRTGPGVRCEIETQERCTIRLNESTELTLKAPRDVELSAGKIWCGSETDATIQVKAASPRASDSASQESRFHCAIPSNGAFVGEVKPDGGWQVITPIGDIEVTLGGASRRLKPGEIARIEQGQLAIEPNHADAILITSWMHPLLVLKGHDSPELQSRVNRLLAQVGRSKLAHLYEHEIRSLGEHAALPLLRYVESPLSRDDSERRQYAMELAADMATTWLVNDLIRLLADDQPAVRVAAATALRRLTRQSLDREPDQWSEPLDQLAESLERWRLWQLEFGRRYEPPRPAKKALVPRSPL